MSLQERFRAAVLACATLRPPLTTALQPLIRSCDPTDDDALAALVAEVTKGEGLPEGHDFSDLDVASCREEGFFYSPSCWACTGITDVLDGRRTLMDIIIDGCLMDPPEREQVLQLAGVVFDTAKEDGTELRVPVDVVRKIAEGSSPGLLQCFADFAFDNPGFAQAMSVGMVAACRAKVIENVRIFAEYPYCDLSVRDGPLGRTALMEACAAGRADIVAEVAQMAASRSIDIDPEERDKNGMTAVGLAIESGFPGMMDPCLSIPGTLLSGTDSANRNAFHLALHVFESDEDKAAKMIIDIATTLRNLKKPHDLNQRDQNGESILAAALRKGRRDVIEALMYCPGMRYNNINSTNQTASAVAMSLGDEELLVFVLNVALDTRVEMDLKQVGDDGTSLMLACVDRKWENALATLFKFSKRRLDLNLQDNSGRTALIAAVRNDFASNLATLILTNVIERGHELNTALMDEEGTVVYHLVKMNQHLNLGKVLGLPNVELDKVVQPTKGECLTALLLSIQLGHRECTSAIISAAAAKGSTIVMDVNAVVDETQQTALHMAVNAEDADIVRSLLQVQGVNLDKVDNHGQTPLIAALKTNEEIATLIATCGIEFEPNTADEEGTLLFHAINYSRNEAVRRLLLTKGINASSIGRRGTSLSAVGCAMDSGNMMILDVILETCAKSKLPIDMGGDSGMRVFYDLVRQQKTETVEYLVKGAPANKLDPCRLVDGTTAAHVACEERSVECMEAVLNYSKMNMQVVDSSGDSLLHVVMRRNTHLATALAALLWRNDDFTGAAALRFNDVDSHGMHAMEYCIQKNDVDVTVTLLKRPEIVFPQAFQVAVPDWLETNNNEMVVAIISEYLKLGKELDPNGSFGENEMSPLHHAVILGDTQMVDLLLKTNGLDVNATDTLNRTAITTCGAELEKDLILQLTKIFVLSKYMLDIDINAIDDSGRSLLYYLIEREFPEAVEQVMRQFKDNLRINEIMFSGRCCLHHVIELKWVAILALFERFPLVDPNVQAVDSGFTPLHLCAQNGDLTAMSALLRFRGIQPSIQAKNGKTPLHILAEKAVAAGSKKQADDSKVSPSSEGDALDTNEEPGDENNVTESRGERGGEDGAEDDDNYLNAMVNGLVSECVAKRLKLDVNICDDNGLTPAHYAVANSNKLVCELIMKYKNYDINEIDGNGQTVLHWSVVRCPDESIFCSIVNTIVEMRLPVKPNLRDVNEDTFLHLVVKQDQWTVENRSRAIRKVYTADLAESQFPNPNLLDKDGIAPIIFCAMKKHVMPLQELLGVRRIRLETEFEQQTVLHLILDHDSPYFDLSIGEVVIGLLREVDVEGKYLNMKNALGQTPLHLAALLLDLSEQSVTTLLNSFLRTDHNVQDNQGRVAMHYAIEARNLMFLHHLIRVPSLLPNICDNQRNTGIMQAVKAVSKDKRCLKFTLEMFADMHKLVMKNGETFSSTIDINISDNDGRRVLHYGISVCHPDVVEMLLNFDGGDLTCIYENAPRSYKGEVCAIHHALDYVDKKGADEIQQMLLQYALERPSQFDVNQKSRRNEETPIIRILDMQLNTLLSLVMKFRNLDLSTETCGINPLHLACKRKNAEMTESFARMARELPRHGGLAVNMPDDSAMCAIHHAIIRNQPDICRELVQYDDIDMTVLTADTIMTAVENHKEALAVAGTRLIAHTESVAGLVLHKLIKLLRANTIIDGLGIGQMLNLCITTDLPELVRMITYLPRFDLNFLSRYTDSSIYDIMDLCCDYNSGLVFDCFSDKVIKQKFSINVYIEARRGRRFILYATQRNLVRQLRRALEHPASKDEDRASSAAEHGGPTALQMAVLAEKKECFETLIQHGADMLDVDGNGDTVLHVGTMNVRITRSTDFVDWILAAAMGRDKIADLINLRNSKGQTALYNIIMPLVTTERKVTFDLLIEHGASVSVQDNLGRTPLHEAARIGNMKMCEMLIAVGAGFDSDIVDMAGRTILHDAAYSENLHLVSMLVESRARITSMDQAGESPIEKCKGKSVVSYLRNTLVSRRLPSRVSITYCNMCESDHPWHTHHDSRVYHDLMIKIGNCVVDAFPGVEVFANPLFDPRTGTRRVKSEELGLFEVIWHDGPSGEDIKVFSRIDTDRFPTTALISQRILRVLVELEEREYYQDEDEWERQESEGDSYLNGEPATPRTLRRLAAAKAERQMAARAKRASGGRFDISGALALVD